MRVALTGGIASGKSTAAARLRARGVPVIDYDRLARDVVAPGTPGLVAVVAEFGACVLMPDGELDRAALGRLVFASPDRRDRLERIVHPLVFEAAEAADAAGRAAGQTLVVHEIPLLVEDGDPSAFDAVIVVHAPAAIRRQRLVEERGLTPEQADQRIAAQADDATRLAAAGVVWDGSGTPDQMAAQVDDWLRLQGAKIAPASTDEERTEKRMTDNKPMRRSDREIVDFDEIIDVLHRCPIGHLGLVDDLGPYVVPVNFGFEVVDGRVVVWCHGAPVGRKVSAIAADPRVCFQAEICHELVTDVPLGELTTVYESVIGFGRAAVATDTAQALHGLAVLVEAVAPGRGQEMPAAVPPGVIVIRIDLDTVTGKRRPSPRRAS